MPVPVMVAADMDCDLLIALSFAGQSGLGPFFPRNVKNQQAFGKLSIPHGILIIFSGLEPMLVCNENGQFNAEIKSHGGDND